jgi:hypothetical protein
MIRGITADVAPHFRLKVYDDPANAGEFIPEILGKLVYYLDFARHRK